MRSVITVIVILLSPLFITVTCNAEDTLHYDVVSEYIRSLGAIHNLQLVATKEIQDDGDDPVKKMMSGIRSSTRIKLELNASIGALEGMTLKEPFETLLPTTIHWYKEKINLHNELIAISKTFLARPKPGIDYSKMTARAPEITATLEYIDESIFKMMVLVFALLIDEKPDNKGHMSHLNITKAQRQKLIDNINGLFGSSLNKKDKNWTVSSAALLKAYLLKDYKCSDEWQ
jgi:hypothetical protein